MKTAVIGTALLGLLVFGLGAAVSLARMRFGPGVGYREEGDLVHRLSLAHSNAAEFCPMLAILMLLVQYWGAPNWVVWVSMGAVASRYLHAVGIVTASSLHRRVVLRFVGAAGTYLCGLLLVVAVFIGSAGA